MNCYFGIVVQAIKICQHFAGFSATHAKFNVKMLNETIIVRITRINCFKYTSVVFN
jgi:hypothetical protein